MLKRGAERDEVGESVRVGAIVVLVRLGIFMAGIVQGGTVAGIGMMVPGNFLDVFFDRMEDLKRRLDGKNEKRR